MHASSVLLSLGMAMGDPSLEKQTAKQHTESTDIRSSSTQAFLQSALEENFKSLLNSKHSTKCLDLLGNKSNQFLCFSRTNFPFINVVCYISDPD